MIGREVGSYRIAEKLGEGGMGVVYRAEHAALGKRAAVKVLLPEYSHNQDLVDRFFNEAKAATAIDHPGIVEVFDFGHAEDGSAYIVMEFLDGEDLGRRIGRRGKLEIDEVVAIGRMVAGALAAAHREGIVHRDLKPDNVYMVTDPDVPGGERAKVLDFGIAKLLDVPETAQVKTRTGTILGTPAYMSPEQCRGYGEVDTRSDIYSLGCVLYKLAVGQGPFPHQGTGEILAAHLHHAPPRPSSLDPSVPRWLDDLLLWTLAKEPRARPESMAEIAEVLERRELPAARHTAPGTRRARSAAGEAVASAAAPTPAPVSGGARTTLSGAAGEPSEAPGAPGNSRALLFTGVAAAVAALVVAALFGAKAVLGDGGQVAAAKEGAVVDAGPAGDGGEGVGPGIGEGVEEEREEEARVVTFAITSEPEGAGVYRVVDGNRVGTTPFDSRRQAAEGQAEFRIKKEGFEDRVVALDAATGGEEHVVLRRVGKGDRAARRKREGRRRDQERERKLIKDGALDPYAE